MAERFVLGLGAAHRRAQERCSQRKAPRPRSLPEQLDAIESLLIRNALAESHGNIQATADALGIPRRTLNEKMRRYGLERHEHR